MTNERQNGYVKQLEIEIERLRRKKKRSKAPAEYKEIVVEKVVEKPIEVIKHIYVEYCY